MSMLKNTYNVNVQWGNVNADIDKPQACQCCVVRQGILFILPHDRILKSFLVVMFVSQYRVKAKQHSQE